MTGEIDDAQVQTLMKWAYCQGALDEKTGAKVDAESFIIHACLEMEEMVAEIQKRKEEENND